MSVGPLPADDDISPRADLQRACVMVERERNGGIAFLAAILVALAWRGGHSFDTGPEVLLLAILMALGFIYARLCGMQIAAYKREMRGLSPRL